MFAIYTVNYPQAAQAYDLPFTTDIVYNSIVLDMS